MKPKQTADAKTPRRKVLNEIFGVVFQGKRFCTSWRLGVFALAVCFGSNLFAQTPAPALEAKIAQAAQQVQTAQGDVQKLKDAWDRSRLESTLYSQRAQRAYKRWA